MRLYKRFHRRFAASFVSKYWEVYFVWYHFKRLPYIHHNWWFVHYSRAPQSHLNNDAKSYLTFTLKPILN